MEKADLTDTLLLFPLSYEYYYMPEIALPRLTAYLRENGCSVDQRDLNAEYWGEFLFTQKVFILFLGYIKKNFQAKDNEFYTPVTTLFTEFLDHSKFNISKCRHHVYKNRKEIFAWIYEQTTIKRLDKKILLENIATKDVLLDLYIAWFIKTTFAKQKYKVVGISIISPQQIIQAVKLAIHIKKQDTKIKIVVGGPWAKLGLEFFDLQEYQFLFDYFDILVISDGEEPLLSVIKGTRLNSIENIVFKNEHGEIIKTKTKTSPALPDLPVPDFDGFDLDLYSDRMIPVERASMCYYRRCSFCWHNHSDRKWNKLEPLEVIRRVVFYHKKHNVDWFSFIDNAVDENYSKQICNEIIKRKLKINWLMQARFNKEFLDLEYVKLLKKSGCHMIFFGLESAKQETLEHYKKGIKIDNVVPILKNLKTAGIRSSVYLMVYPNQTKEDIEQTYNFCIENKDVIDMAIVQEFLLNKNCLAYHKPKLLGINAENNSNVILDFYDLPFNSDGYMHKAKELQKMTDDFMRKLRDK